MAAGEDVAGEVKGGRWDEAKGGKGMGKKRQGVDTHGNTQLWE